MSENEALPASSSSPSEGRPDDSVLAALPEKLRVHALARLVGSSSREVLAVLARLDVAARSAQSSVDRATVSQVVEHLFPSEKPAEEPAAAEPMDSPPGDPDDALPEPPPESPAAVGAAAAPAALGGDAEPEVTGAIGTRPAAPAALFLSPETTDGESGGRRRRRGSRSTGVVTPDESTGPAAQGADESDDSESTTDSDDAEDTSSDAATGGDGDADDEAGRRRRRRGRRGRGRGRGGADDESGEDSGEGADGESSDSEGDDTESDDSDGGDSSDEGDDSAEGSSGSSRRRRRRRRRGNDDSGSGDGSGNDDPPNTVTHVREKDQNEKKRSSDDEVKGVKGSTRLEAKRQRRRDGREQGRRRPSILSESEFLARREAVERTMVVRQQADRNQIGVLEDGVLVEHFVASSGQNSMVGNVYLGRVQNVLPSMEAAFVDIGRGRNAVLYAGEVNWDASGLEGKQRKIEQALSSGDSVLVQVTKDPVGHKGARLTTQISLPGRFLVYVPGGGATGISRKLPEPERKRLKEILKRIVPSEAGVIIRTAAEGVDEEELDRDVRRLAAQWEVIERTGREAAEGKGKGKGGSKAPTLVHEEPDLLIRVVRDMFNEDFSSLVISGEQAWETLEGYISHVAPELTPRLSRHIGPEDVFSAYRIDEQLVKALDRKVWLPSGGTLVIDRTEAMTVVDVNTGKFTGSGGNLEETVTRNNLEAAEEVVRQLRLRDIGGMIVIDFIDMVLESNRDLVLRRLTECLGRDRTRHQVAEVTSLGLVQMTRKRVGQGLLDEFSTPCEHCKGRGVIVHSEPVTNGNGHDHGGGRSGQNGSSGTSNSGSSSSGASSSSSSGSSSGEQGQSGGDGSGQNGSSGSGRRRGRGRRGAQSDGGSPTTVAASATTGGEDTNGASGHVPSPADVAGARRSGSGVDAADEPEVALEADLADESTGTSESGSVESGTSESGAAESEAADSEAAETGTAEGGSTESETEAVEPAPAGDEPDQPEAPAVGTPPEAAAEDTAAPATEEATTAPATEAATTAPEATEDPSTEAPAVATTEAAPAPVSDEPDQPETAAAEEDTAPGGRRRRRAASRPAGPPVAVGGT
ncbi:translation initiation factor IF-2 N-terminal domain-containing protein [Actinomycetospora endophytica]|uniref:Translation initiation factor IF-2 N-terminal domain-containing protein n=1 Tax=Actinomycetospora endophytica TaxID=2291215 RepID=A0ABS8PIE7_9PSEU|nr:translation initiation factor IF-2 N-terminal domain-containing protein [Actinomycetospora endophytica]MCD2198029.1 translation initiation factor IF-2 N-terminal domain-containing protein [Actinomycetospora endophytica]